MPSSSGTMQLSLALCLVCLLLQAAFQGGVCQGWHAFKNDATEIIPGLGLYPEPPPELESNKTMNRAENGGRPPHHPFETKGRAGGVNFPVGPRGASAGVGDQPLQAGEGVPAGRECWDLRLEEHEAQSGRTEGRKGTALGRARGLQALWGAEYWLWLGQL